MFDIESIATLVLIGAGISSLVLFSVFLWHSRRPKRRPLVDNDVCYMCRRPTPVTDLHVWNIRNGEQHVCSRCHPYYKQRFNRHHQPQAESHPEPALEQAHEPSSAH